MKKYSISADNVVRHYDLTGKLCPLFYVEDSRWAVLKKSITAQKLYRVQIGAFSDKNNAEEYKKKAEAAGFTAFVVEVS